MQGCIDVNMLTDQVDPSETWQSRKNEQPTVYSFEFIIHSRDITSSLSDMSSTELVYTTLEKRYWARRLDGKSLSDCQMRRPEQCLVHSHCAHDGTTLEGIF